MLKDNECSTINLSSLIITLKVGSIMKDTYASFEGQIQQVLFNGEQWGLWNIRSATDTTLYGEFQR